VQVGVIHFRCGHGIIRQQFVDALVRARWQRLESFWFVATIFGAFRARFVALRQFIVSA
jgi:hypothetical protein